MRRFLTIGIKSNGKIAVLAGAENDKSDHVAKFFSLAAGKKKGGKRKKSQFAEVQVIDLSRGVIKRKRFDAVEGDGKRTVARTVKAKKKSARKTARPEKKVSKAKRTVARTVKAKNTPAKKSAKKKDSRPKAKKKAAARAKKPAAPATAKSDEGMFPAAKSVD